jgi:hypothetical protein
MKWLEWKNIAINENYIYYRNEKTTSKKEGQMNFEGIHYKINNVSKLKYYRLQKKTHNCAYLQFNNEILNEELTKLVYKVNYETTEKTTQLSQPTKTNISKETTKNMEQTTENIRELLFKKESRKQQILVNKYQEKPNKFITPHTINYSNFFEECYKYKYICFDTINIPNSILQKIDVLDFIYKCYLINCIPIFISKLNIEQRIVNSLGIKLELPYIVLKSFEDFIFSFNQSGSSNKELSINIPFIFINEISKKDYDLDKLIKKTINIINRNIKPEQNKLIEEEKKIPNNLIKDIEFKNYFKSQKYTNLKYDDVLLIIDDDKHTNNLINIIYYLLQYKNNLLKPRFFCYDTKYVNDFLSILEFTYQDNKLKIPIFLMKENYINNKNFNWHNEKLDKKITYILTNNNNNNNNKSIFRDVLSYIIPQTIQEYSKTCIDLIKSETNSNYVVGINLYHSNRLKHKKLNKYIFLNEIYYILSINHLIENIIKQYLKYLQENPKNKIMKPTIQFIIFCKKEDIHASQHIFGKIEKGLKTPVHIKYNNIHDFDYITNLDNMTNQIYMRDLYIMSSCDTIITANNLFSLLSIILNNKQEPKPEFNKKVDTIYYPKKWLKDNIPNMNFIKMIKYNNNNNNNKNNRMLVEI